MTAALGRRAEKERERENTLGPGEILEGATLANTKETRKERV